MISLWIVLLIFSLADAKRQQTVRFVGIKSIGKYSGVDDDGIAFDKTYFVSRYIRANHIASRSFCKSHGLDLLSIESNNELQKLKSIERSVNESVIVGGFKDWINGESGFFWIATGNKVLAPIINSNDNGNCLVMNMGQNISTKLTFITNSCTSSELPFICQEVSINFAN